MCVTGIAMSKEWLKFIFVYEKSVISEKLRETLDFVEMFTSRCILIDLERTTRIWRDRLLPFLPPHQALKILNRLILHRVGIWIVQIHINGNLISQYCHLNVTNGISLKTFCRSFGISSTAWKVPKCGVFPGPYFQDWIRTRKKLRIWKLFTQCFRTAVGKKMSAINVFS